MTNNQEKNGFEIAIIGMSCRFPGANNIEQFWENLKNGINSIQFFTKEELKNNTEYDSDTLNSPDFVPAKGIIKGIELFDAYFFGYSPLEAEIMDPQMRIFHEVCWEALEDGACDPSSYNGLIGLFSGGAANRWWEILTIISGKNDKLGKYTSDLLIDKDYSNTHISYKLDLKGPSVNIHTACSTALTAVDLACRSLLTGQCSAALAGGSAVQAQSAKGGGYIYEEGMIRSKDGYVRAFDANASGTVFSDGVGAVLLKRLDIAIEDKNEIYAIIKGFGINNDGSYKSSFTAPSQEQQTNVIISAFSIAEIEPDSISYLETHGTGTLIGDPIEIDAIKIAFNSPQKKYCAIGSVKTNIGHLDTAAGIAGLIKVALCLYHRQLVPSLNFDSPNPHLDLDNTPFYVNTRLKDWINTDYPLRAGLNSFGVGGTNVHLILEEAQIYNTSESDPDFTSREFPILTLSARSTSALKKMENNLAYYLQKNPEKSWEDICYTLKIGRKAFDYRSTLVSKNINEAISFLETNSLEKAKCKNAKRAIFMFPGQGSQYLNMGRQIYESESIFRKEMDKCFQILKLRYSVDLKEILYNNNETETNSKKKQVNETQYTQPLLFFIEYSLSKLLMEWGIQPFAMIAHSIGEYTAACLAGVFSLEDAIELVYWRGKLMQQIPAGSMLSVGLSEEELIPIKDPALSIAAINSSGRCVISGPNEIIEKLSTILEEKSIPTRKLHTSHAFHSAMMDPILIPFHEKLHHIKLMPPNIPFISNVSGTWITDSGAQNPVYWVNHLRNTVRFRDGIHELLNEKDALFIEVGPGNTLCHFLKQESGKDKYVAINLIKHPDEKINDALYLSQKLGQIWTNGININWHSYYANEKRHHLHLPTYPFEGKPFWIEGNPIRALSEGIKSIPGDLPREEFENWFYSPCWVRTVSPLTINESKMSKLKWLVLLNNNPFCKQFVELLIESEGINNVTQVFEGNSFSCLSQTEYMLKIEDEEGYEKLLSDLSKKGQFPNRIINMLNIHNDNTNILEETRFNRAMETGFYSLIYLARALGKYEDKEKIQISVITDQMQEVFENDIAFPEGALVLGPVTVIPTEFPNIKCLSVDINLKNDSNHNNSLIKNLLEEFNEEIQENENIIAFRGRYRMKRVFEQIKIKPISSTHSKPSLKKHGVYLITGGTGGIGFEIGESIARNTMGKIFLTSLLPFPSRSQWEEWIKTHKVDDPIRKKIERIEKIEKEGAHIEICIVDVTDPKGMKKLIENIIEKYGHINGIIHAAGIAGGGLINLKTREMADAVIKPKAKGIIVLNQAIKGINPEFIVVFSSINTILPLFGQVDYCSANAFLDAFAYYKTNQENVFTISIAWDAWKDVGIALEASKERKNTELEKKGIATHEGMNAFFNLLESRLPNVAVSTRNLENRIHFQRFGINFHEKEYNNESNLEENLSNRPELYTTYVAPDTISEKKLISLWEQVLGINPIGIEDDFFELGGDSLKAVSLISKIKKEFNIVLQVRDIFSQPQIKKLAKLVQITPNETNSTIAIEPAEEKEYYSLSEIQKRLYILNQIDNESLAYNLTQAIIINGKLDKEKMEKAFQLIIQRHENLRTSFKFIKNQAAQVIYPTVDFQLHYLDWDSDSIDELIEDFVKPFDLSIAPLFRALIVRWGIDKHILIMDTHHIISDQTSLIILVKELIDSYANKSLNPVYIQYKDFSEWQKSTQGRIIIEKQKKFWIDKYSGNLPRLEIFTDFERPEVQNFEGETIHFSIESMIHKKITLLVKETGTTLYIILLAAFNILLSKLSLQKDIIIGSPVAGREFEEFQNVNGIFINTIPLRNQPSPEKTINEFLSEVKTNTLEAFANQSYPFGELIEQLGYIPDISRNPIYDVELIVQNANKLFNIPELEDISFKEYPFESKIAQLDIVLEAIESENEIECKIQYCTKLFKKETIEKMIQSLRQVLIVIIENGDCKIRDIVLEHKLKRIESTELKLDKIDFDF